jgi:hypothetical protein
MRKMMLLAVMMALAAMMLAAAPAFAQDGGDNKATICHIPPGNPENAHTISVGEAAVPAHLAHGDFEGPCPAFFDRDFFDRDVVDVEPFITQDIEQEAESGDITQNFDVSQTGDNSNQTVGIQGTANTGNAQNAIGVVDADDFGDFDDDRVLVDDNDGICEDDDDEDCFFFGDDVFFGNDGVFVFGDDNEECDENGDDEDCIVIVDDFFGDFGDFDGDFDGDVEIEDSGASIELSPTQTVTSDQQVNQAAAASGDDCVPVWDPWWQTWVCLPT